MRHAHQLNRSTAARFGRRTVSYTSRAVPHLGGIFARHAFVEHAVFYIMPFCIVPASSDEGLMYLFNMV
jgi:hypothetical protein